MSFLILVDFLSDDELEVNTFSTGRGEVEVKLAKVPKPELLLTSTLGVADVQD